MAVGFPDLVAAPQCTKLVIPHCSLSKFTTEEIDMLGPFIRKNTNLANVHLYRVSDKVSLEELAQAV
ncbi:hypothetical protein BGZ74_002595 [Mortierella antarctica]|nr:hypothetical protein BGZ74_002595 [Mortierella antarctica]